MHCHLFAFGIHDEVHWQRVNTTGIGFHGMWPALMVMDFCKSLPAQFIAEPRVHLGQNFEVDIDTFSVDEKRVFESNVSASGVAAWAPPEPTLTLELDPTKIYEYEVLTWKEIARVGNSRES